LGRLLKSSAHITLKIILDRITAIKLRPLNVLELMTLVSNVTVAYSFVTNRKHRTVNHILRILHFNVIRGLSGINRSLAGNQRLFTFFPESEADQQACGMSVVLPMFQAAVNETAMPGGAPGVFLHQ
jgi:hypothetical protein